MLVTKIKGNQYTVITTGKEYKVNVTRILPFYYEKMKHDPYKIAEKNLDD